MIQCVGEYRLSIWWWIMWSPRYPHYLRVMVLSPQQQTNWVMLLFVTQFAYNATCTITTKISFFYANHEYESDIARHETNFIRTQRANMLIAQLKNLHKQLVTNLRFLTMRSKIYYDKRRFEEIDFKMREKAFLLRKNLRITRESNKLNHVKIESFRVFKNIKETSFELELSNNMNRKHSVFHAFLLKSAHSDTSTQELSNEYIEFDDNEKEYEVEEILNTQLIDERSHYLVKWKDYESSKNTWESRSNLKHCQILVKKYHRQNSMKKTIRRRKQATQSR